MDYLKIGKANELKDRKNRAIYRSFEILPGLLAWSSFGLLILLSFFKPFWVAVFIIAFDLYWLVRIAYFYSHLAAAFRMMKKIKRTDWQEKLKSENLAWQEIYHLVFLPFYKENEEIIVPSIEALADSNYPVKEKMIVVLAREAKAGQEAQKISQKIEEKYGNRFFKFLTTEHPEDIPGELAGKGSNTAWAGKKAKELIDRLDIPYENIIVSSFDIDTVVPADYFSRLTYVYLTAADRLRASYQPVPLYFNNIWEAPFLSRIAAFSTTFWALLNQERPKRLKTFSSHSMPFKALIDVDFWMTDIVTEDNVIFFQCFLKYDGNYRVVPLYFPVYMDANVGKSFIETAANVYRQHRRWGWGAETIPYILFGFLKNKKIPVRKKITHSFDYIESFWSWATNSFIIAIFGWLPGWVGGIEFKTSILALNLPDIAGGIGSFAMIALIFSAFFSINLLLLKIGSYKKKQLVWLTLQWLFTPLIMVALVALPALDAQTRLMFGKYMGFWNTPKHRKNYSK
ncbi:MAG: glycosyltransferase family 2 protein [Parcubacteria group bacterium]|nr:glycosyltransferase family 2 protein [Parcubacteria group bacterium]